jgi:pyruvate formate lyase activating enzyme
MIGPDDTRPETLINAAEIGRRAGLRYIYAGNLPGRVGDLENTRCPNCAMLLVERYGYRIVGYHLTPNGRCPSCDTAIPGRWPERFEGQITERPIAAGFGRRLPPIFSP